MRPPDLGLLVLGALLGFLLADAPLWVIALVVGAVGVAIEFIARWASRR